MGHVDKEGEYGRPRPRLSRARSTQIHWRWAQGGCRRRQTGTPTQPRPPRDRYKGVQPSSVEYQVPSTRSDPASLRRVWGIRRCIRASLAYGLFGLFFGCMAVSPWRCVDSCEARARGRVSQSTSTYVISLSQPPPPLPQTGRVQDFELPSARQLRYRLLS